MISIGTTLKVYTGDSYNYEATVNPDGELFVAYIDEDHKQRVEITFASKDEMRALANAMLRACDIS
jgi:hypothetical protein